MVELIILASILVVVIWYFIAREFYIAAMMKGFNEKRYLWLPFILGIVGCLLVIALPDRGNGQKIDILTSKTSQPSSRPVSRPSGTNEVVCCDYCGTDNPKGAKMCKNCHKPLK